MFDIVRFRLHQRESKFILGTIPRCISLDDDFEY